jgi:hypothetical protein
MPDLEESFALACCMPGRARGLTSIVAERPLTASVDAPTDLLIDPRRPD